MSNKGLTTAEALERAKQGKNVLTQGKKKSLFSVIAEQFASPLLLLLVAASVISIMTGEIVDVIIIIVVVLANVIIGTVQELSLAVLRNCDCEIVVDAGSWKGETLAFLKKASVVISSEEFRDPVGRDIFSIQECASAQKAMTRGEKPIRLDDGEVPVASVPCVDSLAAGDIFHGAFCFAYYHKQLDFKAALTFASTIATESVKYEGPWEWAKQI